MVGKQSARVFREDRVAVALPLSIANHASRDATTQQSPMLLARAIGLGQASFLDPAAGLHFLEDGQACLTNNAAERSPREMVLGRKAWLFAGYGRGGQRAALIYFLIGPAKLNDLDPQTWLAELIARFFDLPASRLPERLSWDRNAAA